MVRITRTDISRMGLYESIGFYQSVVGLLDLLPRGESKIEQLVCKQVDLFLEAFKALMKASGCKAVSRQQPSDSDGKRDKAWRNARRYARAMVGSPDPAVQEAARMIDEQFRLSGEVDRLPQVKETGALDTLIRQLHGLGDEVLQKAGFMPWLEEMERYARQFLEDVDRKAAERAAHPKGHLQQCRQEMAGRYTELVKTIEVVDLLAPELVTVFIRHLNVVVSEEKTRQKRKRTRKENKDKPGTEKVE